MDKDPPGWAERWFVDQRYRERHSVEYLPDEQPHCNRDRWLERYVQYLTREHKRLGGGAIGIHYLDCITASYHEFLSTGTQQARFRTWVGIRTICQWLTSINV
jgi:hypothetical protein